jgi:hypothetical protein
MPRFSVILIHYQGATPHREMVRGVNSLMAQTNQDFELLAYHNGPLLDESLPMPVKFTCSEAMVEDWGIHNRDRGIREATGDYIVHFNADNVLYPDALEKVSAAIERPARIFHAQTKQAADTNAIVVFSIWNRGFQRFGEQYIRFPKNPEYKVLMSGNPPKEHYIDAMQWVMRRDLWLAEGGYVERGHSGDGVMAQRFAAKYGYRAVEDILGEHY